MVPDNYKKLVQQLKELFMQRDNLGYYYLDFVWSRVERIFLVNHRRNLMLQLKEIIKTGKCDTFLEQLKDTGLSVNFLLYIKEALEPCSLPLSYDVLSQRLKEYSRNHGDFWKNLRDRVESTFGSDNCGNFLTHIEQIIETGNCDTFLEQLKNDANIAEKSNLVHFVSGMWQDRVTDPCRKFYWNLRRLLELEDCNLDLSKWLCTCGTRNCYNTEETFFADALNCDFPNGLCVCQNRYCLFNRDDLSFSKLEDDITGPCRCEFSEKYQHILIDEYQDFGGSIALLENVFLKPGQKLEEKRTFWVIFDEAQKGSPLCRPSRLRTSFDVPKSDCPVFLDTCYRSTVSIAQAAKAFAHKEAYKYGHVFKGPKVTVMFAGPETDGVAKLKEILQKLKKKGCQGEEITVVVGDSYKKDLERFQALGMLSVSEFKGLENKVVVYVNDGSPTGILHYTAISRARWKLYILCLDEYYRRNWNERIVTVPVGQISKEGLKAMSGV